MYSIYYCFIFFKFLSNIYSNINMTTFVIAMVATLVCALVGGWFGQKMVKKHFVKAGIV